MQPWQGIKDATEEGSESVSRHLLTKKFIGSEDCLNLNVYSPEVRQHRCYLLSQNTSCRNVFVRVCANIYSFMEFLNA